jgi:hypothetical protein
MGKNYQNANDNKNQALNEGQGKKGANMEDLLASSGADSVENLPAAVAKRQLGPKKQEEEQTANNDEAMASSTESDSTAS